MAANHQQMPQSTRMSGKRQVFTSFMSSPCSRSLMPNLPLYHQQRQWQRQRQWQQWHRHQRRHWQQQQQQQQQQHHHQHALRDLQNNRLQQENHNSWQHMHRPSSSASSLFPPPPTSGPGVLTSQRMMFWHPTRRPRVREKKHIIPGMHGLCLMGYSERGTQLQQVLQQLFLLTSVDHPRSPVWTLSYISHTPNPFIHHVPMTSQMPGQMPSPLPLPSLPLPPPFRPPWHGRVMMMIHLPRQVPPPASILRHVTFPPLLMWPIFFSHYQMGVPLDQIPTPLPIPPLTLMSILIIVLMPSPPPHLKYRTPLLLASHCQYMDMQTLVTLMTLGCLAPTI